MLHFCIILNFVCLNPESIQFSTGRNITNFFKVNFANKNTMEMLDGYLKELQKTFDLFRQEDVKSFEVNEFCLWSMALLCYSFFFVRGCLNVQIFVEKLSSTIGVLKLNRVCGIVCMRRSFYNDKKKVLKCDRHDTSR